MRPADAGRPGLPIARRRSVPDGVADMTHGLPNPAERGPRQLSNGAWAAIGAATAALIGGIFGLIPLIIEDDEASVSTPDTPPAPTTAAPTTVTSTTVPETTAPATTVAPSSTAAVTVDTAAVPAVAPSSAAAPTEAVVTAAPAEPATIPSIQILAPADGASGGRSIVIRGIASPSDADVWIGVTGRNPDNIFFVGGFPVRAAADGQWSAQAQIGAAADYGERFVITAWLMDPGGTATLQALGADELGDVYVERTQLPESLADDSVLYQRADS